MAYAGLVRSRDLERGSRAVTGSRSTQLPDDAWRDVHLTHAWRTRNFRAVFHLACRHGLKPVDIAQSTGLPIDQVLNVMRGNETLRTAEQIESVARGLRVPGQIGKAGGTVPSGTLPTVAARSPREPNQQPERRGDHPGIRISELRNELCWSREYLAERAEVSVATIAKVERQERTPSLEMMRKIASALGVAVGEIADPLTLGKPGRKRGRLPDCLPDGLMRRADFAAACKAHDLKIVFTAAVDDAGFTVSHLARRCEMSIGQVNAYMQNGRKPTGPIIARVSDGLRIPGAMFGIVPQPWEIDLKDSPESFSLATLPAETVEAMKRREFLLGMAATAGLGAAAGMTPTFKHVDPELIPYFQQQLEGHYRADMLLGPRALINTVTAQCNLIGQLIDDADEPTRQSMAVVGTSFATFAAWLYLDAGDIAAALYWHDGAQEMAHRSRDRQAIACALVDRAMARTDQGKGTAVVDLCNGALTDSAHLSPELRVFALQQQAHGASLLGDRRQVDALLDAAGHLIDQVDVEVWGTACLRTPHYVEVQRATCYGRLGLASEALRVWQQIIPAAPSNARRDIGVWMARQATLSASLREPEQTVELARHAVKVALETGSARVRRELATTEVTMTPWQAEPVGQDFAEVLAPISERV
jgi:transcriptional regulator with XRE-family HTH domain